MKDHAVRRYIMLAFVLLFIIFWSVLLYLGNVCLIIIVSYLAIPGIQLFG